MGLGVKGTVPSRALSSLICEQLSRPTSCLFIRSVHHGAKEVRERGGSSSIRSRKGRRISLERKPALATSGNAWTGYGAGRACLVPIRFSTDSVLPHSCLIVSHLARCVPILLTAFEMGRNLYFAVTRQKPRRPHPFS